MSVFKEYKLAELYEIGSGLSKSADQFGFGQPFLSFSDVFWNYFVPDELSQLVNSNEKEQLTHSVKKGDVFLTRTSETIEELGMSAVALKDYPNSTFNGFTKRLRPKIDDVVHPRFIGYYLRSPYFRAEVTAYSTLTTRASLNNGIIERLKVKLPSFEVQKQIASVLANYDDLIENNNQRIQLLEDMAEEIYKEWFVRFRFPGYENAVFVDKNGNKVTRENDGAFPEGWKLREINDIVKLISGYAFKSKHFDENGKYGLVTIKNVQNGFFVTKTTDKVAVLPNNMKQEIHIKEKDILLSLTGNIGRICLAYGSDYLLNQRVAKIKPVEDEFFEFAYMFFRSEFLRKTLENFSNGAAQQNLSPIDTGLLEFNFPTDDLIKEYAKLTNSFLEEIIVLLNKNKVLQETRDLLLPRLISGKLSVVHLLDDEKEYNSTEVALNSAAEPETVYKTSI